MKQNRFPTLNSALESEDLLSYWPTGLNIGYDQVLSITVDGKYISVTRFNDGQYERPIHYGTLMEDRIVSYRSASV